MPSLNFTFKPELVREGIKRQTIRPVMNREYKAGDILHLFKGQRTPDCEKLGTALCSDVFTIEMRLSEDFPDIYFVKRDFQGCTWYSDFTKSEIEDLAKRDGFDSAEQMWLWFRYAYKCADWIFWVIRWHKPVQPLIVNNPSQIRKILEEKAKEETT